MTGTEQPLRHPTSSLEPDRLWDIVSAWECKSALAALPTARWLVGQRMREAAADRFLTEGVTGL